MKQKLLFLLLVATVAAVTPAMAQDREPDYSTSDGKDWMYNHQIESKKYSGEATQDAGLDLFYIYPTVCQDQTDYSKEHDGFVSIDDALMRADDLDVTTSGKGAFEMTGKTFATYTNVYAPYYRQTNIVDAMRHAKSDEELCDYLYNGLAYQDIAYALEQYFNFINPGGTRPYILAGHSQGSAMLRIVMEHWFTQDEVHMEFLDNMVACYALGFGVSKTWTQNIEAATGVKFANDATSSHVYVSWNTEGPGGSGKSLLWPEDAISVNPLTWTTDGQAGPEMNTGAKVYYRDNIVRPGMYGAQISAHGTVVCPEIDKSNYMDEGIGFGDRCLHGWDYAAYWNNIAENGMARAASWLGMKQVDVRNLPEHMYVSKCEYSGETDPDIFDADCNEALRAGSTWWIPPYANALRLSLKVENGYKFEYDEGDNTCYAYYTVSKYIKEGKVVIETGHLADPFPFYWVSQRTPDYTDARDWVVNHSLNPNEAVEKAQETTTDYGVDLFYVYPTVSATNSSTTVDGFVDIDDTQMRGVGSKYDGGAWSAYDQQGRAFADMTRVYAPYYRQVSLAKAFQVADAATDYSAANKDYADYLYSGPAYQDVAAALDAYFRYWNNGRPFILAGHSQGSAVIRDIMEHYFTQDDTHKAYLKNLVASYQLGYGVGQSWLSEVNAATKSEDGLADGVRFASDANGTGVIVSWNVTGPDATGGSMLFPADAVSINPLSWTTTSTPAGKSLNLGAIIDGEIVAGQYGATLNTDRGTVECAEIPESEYINFAQFGEKCLHGHDYKAYWENIRHNASDRIYTATGNRPLPIIAQDYSQEENWMLLEKNPTHECDLFFLYPTAVMSGDSTVVLNDEQKLAAKSTYSSDASAIGGYTNVYAPYYRQVPMQYALECTEASQYIDLLRRQASKTDVFASLDYYFEHLNNGRPFILAGHSQGSSLLVTVLDEYMQNHPEYLQRMVATYAIGTQITKPWLEKYSLKGATGATDTGVVIGWNTEGPAATQKSMMLKSNGTDYLINPLNWRTDETYATPFENLGAFEWVDKAQGTYKVNKPGMNDAQIDSQRGALICTTNISYADMDIFGDKSLHTQDWTLFYDNIRENGRRRIEAYLGHPIKVETADYSKQNNWLMYDENPEGEVDLFYLLPTTVSGTGEAVEFFSEADKVSALSVYAQQAKAIEPFTNVYVPFYSQVTSETLMKLDGAKSTDAIALVRANQGRDDVFAALDYYFENINWGRPFILASHSQGSSMAQIVFDEYFKLHPDYLERMIAAYSLGCSWPKAWFDANPHARFASDETETGVIIGWNTEGPDATMPNMLIGREDRTINPLNWCTDETKAETSANLGSYVDGKIVSPGIADAQVDNTRGALICTTSTDYLSPGLFGDKSLHGKDWSLYYVNIRENARKRCATFLGHNPTEIHPTPEEDVKPGDADLNRSVNVNDYNTVKNYILEIADQPEQGTHAFIGADANEDEAIDASDCEKIIDLIFADAANKARRINNEQLIINNVEGFCATANGNQLVISADNATAFMACQMDLGINASDIQSITTDANHRVSYSTLENGKVRMLVTSYANETFNSNEVVTITLTQSINNEQLTMNNGIFTNKAFQSVNTESSETTAISNLSALSYKLKNGKYVENNRIVIVKDGVKFNPIGQPIK